MATAEIRQLVEKYGQPLFPKPRYSIPECLILLGIGRELFYKRVRSGRYQTTKDGSRSFMTHDQLVDAARGDSVAA